MSRKVWDVLGCAVGMLAGGLVGVLGGVFIGAEGLAGGLGDEYVAVVGYVLGTLFGGGGGVLAAKFLHRS